MLCLTVSDDVYIFVPNIVQSTLFSEQHSLFDARVNSKSNQTYFYEFNQIYDSVSISFQWSILPH